MLIIQPTEAAAEPQMHLKSLSGSCCCSRSLGAQGRQAGNRAPGLGHWVLQLQLRLQEKGSLDF